MVTRIIRTATRIAAIVVLAMLCAAAFASLMAMSRPYASTGFRLVKPGAYPWPAWGSLFDGFSYRLEFGPLFPWIGIHCAVSLFLLSRTRNKSASAIRSQSVFLLLWLTAPTTMRVCQHASGNLADAVSGMSGVAWGGFLLLTLLFIRISASSRSGLPQQEPLIHRGGKVTGSLSDADRKTTSEAGDFA
jgi:hypothetical protein